MNALILTLVFLAILVGFILLGRYYEQRQRRTEFQQAMERMSHQFDEFALAIGEQLTPVVRQTVEAFQGFVDAIRREAQ